MRGLEAKGGSRGTFQGSESFQEAESETQEKKAEVGFEKKDGRKEWNWNPPLEGRLAVVTGNPCSVSK